ncbi:hypothetical protein BCR34DRAFT_485124 [Clohesyomyces aquaticus]|uniref:Zn(2)-C6 fungal-type domain-containing protein n=1 Tax=Clohesyomyces aquaticus TaxID=1231657 RepID=A0A1Y1ZKK3_9PLEO|nr:hypothetical protein BCR34DRAFT_485124 [Clohesyomyces aquaticus]
MEAIQPNSQSPVRKKTACAECRQQKMRCDGDHITSDSLPCSRCRRLKIPCVFSAPFKRTHKRKRLQELEEEIATLKRQQPSASPVALTSQQHSGNTPPVRDEIDSRTSTIPTNRNGGFEGQSADPDPTAWRTIEGLELSPGIIDDCFKLFFKEYHPMLPILDPSVTPNTFYQYAPFLFWIIVSIGSRRYTEHPTLIHLLTLPVIRLASQSITTRNNPIERIKGFLLLLSWPFPSSASFRDPSFVLAGMLLHTSMQCGLNTPAFSQDFSKSYSKIPEQDLIRRAEVWAHVVITYQQICSGTGQPNLVSFEVCNEETHLKPLLDMLPSTLKIRLQISDIIGRANKALLNIGLASMTPQQERTMDALLKGFCSELENLNNVSPKLSVWDRLYISAARQDLTAMQFYKSVTSLDMQSSVLIFNATTDILTQFRDLDREFVVHRICTRYFHSVALLSLASLARILKGPFAGALDQARGNSLIDAGISFLRSCSISKGDFGAKCASFAENLGSSNRIFREADGSVNITLRVRNRLSAGPIHDIIKYWRDELVGPEFLQAAPGINQGTPLVDL